MAAARLPTLARHLARRSAFPAALRTRAPAAGYATDSGSSSNSSSGGGGNNNMNNPFASNPSPLRLPPDEQAEFERLQRAANTQEPLDPAAEDSRSSSSSAAGGGEADADGGSSSSSSSNLPLRQGAPPEFEGDVNPRTGEVGGPKNEPLRWGSGGDWSYNGRVTDF